MEGGREIYLSVYLSIPGNCTIRQLIAAGRGIRAARRLVRALVSVLMDPKEERKERRIKRGKGECEWGIGVEVEGRRHYKVAEVREVL